MAAKATWDLTGVNEISAILKDLKQVPNKEGRAAGRAAANVIKAVVIRNAEALDDPETPNKISLNVAVQFNSRLYRRTGDMGFRIGLAGGAKEGKSGKKGPGGDTWYWRLVEFGTKDFPAHPFVRPAMANSTQEATAAFLKRFKKAIENALRKQKRADATANLPVSRFR